MNKLTVWRIFLHSHECYLMVTRPVVIDSSGALINVCLEQSGMIGRVSLFIQYVTSKGLDQFVGVYNL